MNHRALFLFSVAFSTTAAAQTTDTTKLDPVVVSATKSPASRVSVTQPVTIISGEELRARGITRVSDALRLVPGASMVQNGSTGSVNTLFLRGGESRYTKVLIDGVSVNASGGFFDFSHLTVDNIERIEIVRGPASVVYGADAVAGIVQIFTRQGRGPVSLTAEGRAGNRSTREVTLESNGASERWRFSLGGGARRTDGIYSFNNNYYNGTLSGLIGLQPRKGADISVSTRYTNAEFHYPTDFTGAPVDSNSYRVQHRLTVGVDARSQLKENANGFVRAGTNEVSDLTEDIFIPFSTGNPPPPRLGRVLSRNKRRSAEAGLGFRLPLSRLTIGAEYVRETERSVNSEGPVGGESHPLSTFSASRDNKALYSELIATGASGSSWTLAARRDDNSDYDHFTTYRAGLSSPVGQRSRIRASIGTSFNAPAFNQIRPTLYTSASPGLKPERARTWEIGLEQASPDGRVRIAAGYFNQRFRDLIQFVPGGPPSFLGSYDNLTEAESNGYEAELTLRPDNEIVASASYTHARPRVKKVAEEYTGDLEPGDPLLRRPQHSATAALGWSRPRTASFSATASYVGERPDLDFSQFPSPMVTLPDYVKVDIAGSLALLRFGSGAAISLTVRVDNVTDKKYQDVFGFQAPRRTYLAGARVEGAM